MNKLLKFVEAIDKSTEAYGSRLYAMLYVLILTCLVKYLRSSVLLPRLHTFYKFSSQYFEKILTHIFQLKLDVFCNNFGYLFETFNYLLEDESNMIDWNTIGLVWIGLIVGNDSIIFFNWRNNRSDLFCVVHNVLKFKIENFNLILQTPDAFVLRLS